MAMLNLEVEISDRTIGTALATDLINDTLRYSTPTTNLYDLTNTDNNKVLRYPSFEAQGFDMMDSGYVMPAWDDYYIVSNPISTNMYYIKWPDQNSNMWLHIYDSDPAFPRSTFPRYLHTSHAKLIDDESIGVMSQNAYRINQISSTTPVLQIELSDYRNHFNALTLYFNRYPFNGTLSFYNNSFHLEECDIPFTASTDSLELTITNPGVQFDYLFNKLLITFTSPLIDNTMIGLKYIKFGTTLFLSNENGLNTLTDPIEVFGELPVVLDDFPFSTCSLSVRSEARPYEDQLIHIKTDAYDGYYIIDKVDRQAKDIYSISGKDVSQNLEKIDAPSVTFSNNTVNYFLEKLEDKCGVPMPRVDESENVQINMLSGIENCRQYLTAICFAGGFWISSFGSDHPSIVRNIRLNPYISSEAKVLNEYSVFHAPTYQKDETVDGLKYNYNDNDYEYMFPYGKTKDTNYRSVNDVKSKMYDAAMTTSMEIQTMLEANFKYLNKAVVTGDILYSGEKLGDLVTIPTLYDGLVTGYIQSINLRLSTVAIATIGVRSI